MTQPIPEGFRAVTPHLVVRGAAKAIEFYKQAFGAKELQRSMAPDGKLVMHATIEIDGCRIMLGDEMPIMDYWVSPQRLNGTTVGLHLYTADTDKAYERALAAGAKPALPPMDAFWGARYAKVTDPFGHEWSIATHVKDVSPEEMAKAARAFFSRLPG